MVFLSPFLSKWAHERVVRGSTSRLFFSFFPFLLLFSPKKCVSERSEHSGCECRSCEDAPIPIVALG